MLSVGIFINGSQILRLDAVRVKTGKVNTYRLGDDSLMKHRYEDGATVLAIKVLKRHLKGKKA